LQKEQAALESQLVIYKLKYAETSSSLIEAEDNREILKQKNKDLMENLKMKDKIIKNLLGERDEIREAYFSLSSTNRNENFLNYQSSNLNTNNICISQRNSSEASYTICHSIAGNKMSLAQMQNKEKQLRKINTSILDNNCNKSILSKNNKNNNVNSIFDIEKSFTTDEINLNNNNNINKGYNNFTSSGNCNEFVMNNKNNNIVNNNSQRKSTGIISSLKNLFGEKNKK